MYKKTTAGPEPSNSDNSQEQTGLLGDADPKHQLLLVAPAKPSGQTWGEPITTLSFPSKERLNGCAVRPVTELGKRVTQTTPTKGQKHGNTAKKKNTKENYNWVHETQCPVQEGRDTTSLPTLAQGHQHIPASPYILFPHFNTHKDTSIP